MSLGYIGLVYRKCVTMQVLFMRNDEKKESKEQRKDYDFRSDIRKINIFKRSTEFRKNSPTIFAIFINLIDTIINRLIE